MIRELALLPPLALGRVGPSSTPCDAYLWGPNDISPRGTGRTTLVPTESLSVASDGTLRSRASGEPTLKDTEGFRPVCPFIEVHGTWRSQGRTQSGAVTLQVLEELGLDLSQIRWRVVARNLKAYHMTLDRSDRIEATLELRGDDHRRHSLLARSPGQNALVPRGETLPLGALQVVRPNEPFPELRLRFTPAKGFVYGPRDLATRIQSGPRPITLPPERSILNPGAAWCHFAPMARTNPGGLYATDDEGTSLGLIDDVCDAIIECRVGPVAARARIAVGPPDCAPDRRPFVSLADGLKDRVGRVDLEDEQYFDDRAQTADEVRDIFERILETTALMNIDYQNFRAALENAAIARSLALPESAAEGRVFESPPALTESALPLTDHARRVHRRLVSLEVLEDMVRERPGLLEELVRKPMTGEAYFDTKMPPLMRGSDRYPMHLTRRQYDLIARWARRLRDDVEAGS